MGALAGAGDAGPAAPAPVPLRRNRGFRLLWIGQVLSDTGSAAALIAYPLLVLALTRSPALAGLAGTVRLVVQLLLGLPGGALSDRFDRRKVMITCDVIRTAVVALLAVLVLLHAVNWPLVMIIAVIDGAANIMFDPSASAALPVIVSDSQLEQAWAATEARTYGASLVGPALGGFLFGLGSSVPFLADAVSYLVSAGTVSRIRGQFRPERSGKRASLRREVGDGLALVWRNPLLRAVVTLGPLTNFAFTGVIFTITVALRQHGVAPGVIGLVQAGVMAGGVAGGIVAPRLQGRLSLSRMVTVLSVASAALFAVAALILPSPLVAFPVAVTLLLAPASNAALFAEMLRSTPENMRGRVNNTVIMAATGLAAVAPLISGLLVEHASGPWALGAFAAAIGVAAVMCLALPWLRHSLDAAAAVRAADSEAARA